MRPRAPALAAALLLAGTTANAQQDAPKRDWGGVWIDKALEVDVSGIPVGGPAFDEESASKSYPLIGMRAPWNAEGQARFTKAISKIIAGQGKALGWGYPMMMESPAPFEIVFATDRVLIYNIYRDMRVIYTDGRPHPPEDELWPTTWGDSIAHWEGDTLVIDTISVKNPTVAADFAPPLSEGAHYVERLTMTAAGELHNEVTIEDPATLTQPWKAEFTYKRLDYPDRVVLDSQTNDRTGFDGTNFTIEAEKVGN